METEEVRRRLLKDFQSLSEEMELLMNNFFDEKRRIMIAQGRGFVPPMDVFETEKEILCLVELAGVAPPELNVRLEAGALYVSGLRREIPGFERRHYHKMELDFGTFERTLTLPEPVEGDSLKIEDLGGFHLIRLRKKFPGLRPGAGEFDPADTDPRR